MMNALDHLDLVTAKIDGVLTNTFLSSGGHINNRCQQLFYLHCYITEIQEEILPQTAYKAQGVLIDAHRISNQSKIQEVSELINLYNKNKYWFLPSKKFL